MFSTLMYQLMEHIVNTRMLSLFVHHIRYGNQMLLQLEQSWQTLYSNNCTYEKCPLRIARRAMHSFLATRADIVWQHYLGSRWRHLNREYEKRDDCQVVWLRGLILRKSMSRFAPDYNWKVFALTKLRGLFSSAWNLSTSVVRKSSQTIYQSQTWLGSV